MQKEEYVIHARDTSSADNHTDDAGDPFVTLSFTQYHGDARPGDVELSLDMNVDRALEVVNDLVGAIRRCR